MPENIPAVSGGGWLAVACAFHIGLGVSMTIHRFTDFVAGAILGTVLGVKVG